MSKILKISADTGISATFKTDLWGNWCPHDLTQEDMRSLMERYGNWIYDNGGAPVQWERRNHWNPKLAAAKTFTWDFLDKGI